MPIPVMDKFQLAEPRCSSQPSVSAMQSGLESNYKITVSFKTAREKENLLLISLVFFFSEVALGKLGQLGA